MLKKIIIAIVLIIVCILGIVYTSKIFKKSENNGAEETSKQNEQNSTYEAKRADTTINIINNTQTEQENSNNTVEEPKFREETISTFSTKIYTKDSSRQNNVTITCSTLNGTEVPKGETFSFCNTVGKATTAKGYQEADIFTSKGEKVKGLGGGNCQISTTLYNAVLQVPELQVTERHEHSNKVPYIKNGKDAAVAYGSCDFKFVNNTDNTIKILAQNTPDAVTITLLKLVEE